MGGQIAFSDVLVIIGMIAGGCAAIGAVAWLLIQYINGCNDKRDTALADALKDRDRARDEIVKAIRDEIAEERRKTEESDKELHSRVSNIRKEFVEMRQYEKDLKRIEDGINKIPDAIQDLAASIRQDLKGIQQNVTHLNAMQDQTTQRLKAADDRQTAFINLLKTPALAGAE